MSTARQGMSSMEIEHIIAQRVTNAIEAIAIYEARTHVTRDSVDQVARQGAKVEKACAAGPNNKRGYAGKFPSCNKCKLHHAGTCPVKCKKCQKVGHHEKYYRVRASATGCNSKLAITCYGCGEQGHYNNRCPEALQPEGKEWKGLPGHSRYVVNQDGIHVNPSKVESVKNWKTPDSPTEIHSFLGLVGYYRRFIENFSKIVKPLTLLTKKNKTYVWGDKQEESFRIPKEKLCNALVLALPDGPNDFVMHQTKGLDTQFEKRGDGGIYFIEWIWIPSVGGIRKLSMDEAHTSKYSVHSRADKMYYDLRDLYWWHGMKKDIVEYVSRCLTCSKIKAEHQKRSGLLQQPKIPKLTKSAHFLAICEDFKMERLARIYINKIVARHGVPVSIILDRDGRFSSPFWRALQKMSDIEDMLRACVMDFGGSWDTHLSLVEFSYNNSYHKSIKCAPFKALYRRKCRSPVIWAEVGKSELIGPEIVQETTETIMQIKERLETMRDRQKIYADKRRKPLESNGKLAPWYVIPFEIVECVGPVAYRLKLPQEQSCVHDVFHVSNLKKCLADSDLQVPLEEIKTDDKLYFVEEPVELLIGKSRD
nr:putative reverse transcriptase domain-containing protein [Tanacetum cinerariifolium]